MFSWGKYWLKLMDVDDDDDDDDDDYDYDYEGYLSNKNDGFGALLNSWEPLRPPSGAQ